MATLERPVDRGTRLGRTALPRLGQDLREARRNRGLSLASVAGAAGLSVAELSRLERGLSPMVPMITLFRLAGAVGLDLVTRLYPGGRPIRDAPQVDLLGAFRTSLHGALRRGSEVPVPIPGDQRGAWDGIVASVVASPRRPMSGASTADPSGPGLELDWRYGVEVETLPTDAQARHRRIQHKLRDSGLDGVLIVLPATRRARDFVRHAAPELGSAHPVPGRRALELLGAGVDPGGSSIILMSRRPVGSPASPRSSLPGAGFSPHGRDRQAGDAGAPDRADRSRPMEEP